MTKRAETKSRVPVWCASAAMAATLLALAGACADDAAQPAPDAGADAADTNDAAAANAAALARCVSALGPAAFDVAPATDGAQIHADAAFDGEAVWVVWASFAEDGGGDIFGTRIGCDGTVLVPPLAMNVAFDANDLDPSVAASAGRVLVAWHSDNGASPENLDIYLRLFERDGTPVWDAERLFEGVVDGAVNTRNAWMPDLAPFPHGGFGLAGAWGTEGAPAFQVFVQALSSEGEALGDAVNVDLDAEASQIEPELAASPAGELAVLWADAPFEGRERVLARRFALTEAGVGAPAAAAREVLEGAGGARGAVAFATDGDVRYAVTQPSGAGSEVVVVDGDGAALARWQGPAGFVAPALAPSGADGVGVAVAWMRVLSGTRATLLASFPGLAEAIEVASDPPVGPYETVLTAVGPDVVFLAWVEGTSPEFRLRGRFLRAP